MTHRSLGLRSAICWSIPITAAWCLLACRVDDGGNPAYQDHACSSDSYRGFCLPPTKPAAARGDGAVDADDGDDAGDAGDPTAQPSTEGQPCAHENDEKLCYDGPRPTRAEGACISGVSKCIDGLWTECYGQVLPESETCNERDDDCDGTTDEDLIADCVAADTGCAGRLTCMKGHAACTASVDPLPETCNARDDDCDGTIDEDSDRICIDDNAGCSEEEDGIHCKGACASGIQRCRDGALETCKAQIKPRTSEHCDLNEVGIDDDCDGDVDEDCACSGNTPRACYAASADTRTGAVCKPGSQRCEGGAWSACKGAGTPHAEKCPADGVDDDCNGEVDDVPDEGKNCVSWRPGICHHGKEGCVGDELGCITPSAEDEKCNELDDDCDGNTDEEFHLQEDRDHCGDCNTKCPEGSDCCAGECVDLQTNNDHCATCGNPCNDGTTCCDGFCTNLIGDRDNCGTCGHICEVNEQCCKSNCLDVLSNDLACGSCNFPCEGDTPDCVEGNCVSM